MDAFTCAKARLHKGFRVGRKAHPLPTLTIGPSNGQDGILTSTLMKTNYHANLFDSNNGTAMNCGAWKTEIYTLFVCVGIQLIRAQQQVSATVFAPQKQKAELQKLASF